MSMAAGEYVSVHSQADTNRAHSHASSARNSKADYKGEHKELMAIYVCSRAQTCAGETGRRRN